VEREGSVESNFLGVSYIESGYIVYVHYSISPTPLLPYSPKYTISIQLDLILLPKPPTLPTLCFLVE